MGRGKKTAKENKLNSYKTTSQAKLKKAHDAQHD